MTVIPRLAPHPTGTSYCCPSGFSLSSLRSCNFLAMSYLHDLQSDSACSYFDIMFRDVMKCAREQSILHRTVITLHRLLCAVVHLISKAK
jgi:hypothetical protein